MAMALPSLTQELITAYTAAGVWQDRPLYAVVDEHAERSPDTLAMADQHEEQSYAELVRRSSNLAAWLLEQGVRPGATLAVQCGNRTALAVTHLACDRADVVFLPLSNSWRLSELTHLLSIAEPDIVIVGPPEKGFDYFAAVTQLRATVPGLRLIGGMDGVPAEFDYDAVCHTDRPVVLPPRDPNAPRYVMVTSGTTGAPHMSLWSDNNLWYFLSRYIYCVQLRAGDVAVGLAPASTGATGYVFPVLSPLLCGASGILLEHWAPTAALDLMESARATHATAIPTQVLKLLADPSVTNRDFSSLRTFTNSGAAMPPDGARELERVFGCIQHVVYGATDGGTPTMLCFDDPPDKRHTTVGKVYRHNEVRLVDATTSDVAAGEPGEILWRGPTKSYGYLNEPERSEAAWYGDGWYRSGDLGAIDEDGYLSIVGRVKDLIIRGGQNISPREIEDLVIALPEVADVAVVGVPDPVFGERVCACVVLQQGASLTDEQLVERLRQAEVATFKLPEFLEIFDDFPKSTGGKVSKAELRRKLADRASAVQNS
jgi:non-ribosomal peptide synthetase component E (peptide arylation enzyme)